MGVPKGYKFSDETRRRMSEGHRGKPLSEAHRRTLLGNKRRLGIPHTPETKEKLRLSHSGAKTHLWRGGITPNNRLIRTQQPYRDWRKAVFTRDDYTCVECGARSKKGKKVVLNADHIMPFAYFPELRFDVSNGRTLCAPCHRKTDTYAGRGRIYSKTK